MPPRGDHDGILCPHCRKGRANYRHTKPNDKRCCRFRRRQCSNPECQGRMTTNEQVIGPVELPPPGGWPVCDSVDEVEFVSSVEKLAEKHIPLPGQSLLFNRDDYLIGDEPCPTASQTSTP